MTQYIELTLLEEETKMLIQTDKIVAVSAVESSSGLGEFTFVYISNKKRRGKLVPCRIKESYAEIKQKLKFLLVEEEKEIL